MSTAATPDLPKGKRAGKARGGTQAAQAPDSGRMVSTLLGEQACDDRMGVYHAVLAGFSLRSVLIMVDSSKVYSQCGALAKIMGTSDRTLARRLQAPDQMLTPEQSTRALYYAEIMDKATEVLGSRALAEHWMTTPARGLDGELPINLVANAIGYELVSELLTRMDYGVY